MADRMTERFELRWDVETLAECREAARRGHMSLSAWLREAAVRLLEPYGLCTHGVPVNHRCYACEPSTAHQGSKVQHKDGNPRNNEVDNLEVRKS